MRKNDVAFLLVLFVLLIYIAANMLTKIPMIHDAIATATSTPYASISNYLYSPGEAPFYTSDEPSLFTPVAQYKNIKISTSNGSYYYVAMAMDGDHLLFAGRLQEPAQYQTWRQLNFELLCINAISGKVLWQTWVGGPNLVKDGNQVLYAEATNYFEDVGIAAYNMHNGKELWETRFKGKVNLDVFFPAASMLLVSANTHGDSSSYIVDKTTGVIQETYANEKRYIESGAIFSDGIGLKRDGGFGYGPVKGYEIGSGKIIWANYNDFAVSNIAVSGNVAYFVALKAHLLAVDIHTGRVLATLAFSPAFDLTEDKYGKPAYDYLNFAPVVAADNDLVAVYFADKKQLSIFRFNAFP